MTGALTIYADKVRRAGRHGDTELVHLNKDELDALRDTWGEPTLNPDTGLPEYFNFGSLLSAVLPMASQYFMPEAITGIADYLGVGEGLVRGVGGAGLGALSSWATGNDPLTGGLMGGAAGYFAPDALSALGLGSDKPKYDDVGQLIDKLSKDGTLGKDGGLGAGSGKSSLTSMVGPAMLAAGLLTAGNKQQSAAPPAKPPSDYILPKYTGDGFRKYVAQVNPDYTQPGVRQYFKDNAVPAARGRHVEGGGSGRDDSIPAMLSDGEYVIDAETVALLGDGSNEEGARLLDAMRNNIRRHKGKALMAGKFSPNAKPPEGYMNRRAA